MSTTHPHSEAEKLAEDWKHLQKYGYAPGNYMNQCRICGEVVEFVDKRATCCRPCAEAKDAAFQAPMSDDVPQAAENTDQGNSNDQ